jgi:signal transduction histidine kinase
MLTLIEAAGALLIIYLAGVGWLARRWLRAPSSKSKPVLARLRSRGLGVLLLPAVVAAAGIPRPGGGMLVVAAGFVALAFLAFVPRAVTTKVMPLALVLVGLIYWIGIVLHPVASRTQLGLIAAFVFITAGLWLTWRSLDRTGLIATRVLRVTSYTVSSARPRWGLLLLPVIGLVTELVYQMAGWHAIPTMAVVLAALGMAALFPGVAADLALFGLLGFGLYGLALAAFWPHMMTGFPATTSIYFDAFKYGPIVVSSRGLALAAGTEGLALISLAIWLAPRAADDRTRALFRWAPDAELATRVVRLTSTRADAVNSAAAELRRLERDLHDGTQARLVALGMNLRAAERLIPTSPEAATALVAEAREASARALEELRGLVRGICPPVLVDRGLEDAVRALALDTALPVSVDTDLPGRPPLTVETACYFAVAETLTNAVKHSGAGRVQVRMSHDAGSLRITVIDAGCGGADPQHGTGLLGLERRLATLDGVLAVSSPPGGPTIVAIEVPCELTAPSTTSR